MYPEIFNGLGKLTEEHHIHIKENVTPVIHPPGKISVALLDRLKKDYGKKRCNKKNRGDRRLG